MIIAAMASMPERVDVLREVVLSIRPQVDALRVYLNNFETAPDFLNPGEATLSSNASGDLGDAGKFYWFDKEPHTHYLTVDDDMFYPPNYVEILKSEFDSRNKKAVVGVHGFVFSEPIESYVSSRKEKYKGTRALDTAQPVHVIGTATAILSKETIQLQLSDFSKKNMADLQLAIAAQNQNVPMVVISRPADWIQELIPSEPEYGTSIWKETKQDGGRKVAAIARKKVINWKLLKDPL